MKLCKGFFIIHERILTRKSKQKSPPNKDNKKSHKLLINVDQTCQNISGKIIVQLKEYISIKCKIIPETCINLNTIMECRKI
jgi:hypothetical protein